MIIQEKTNHFFISLILAILIHLLLYSKFKDLSIKTIKPEETKSVELNLENIPLKKTRKRKKNQKKSIKKSLKKFLPETKAWTDQIIKSKPFASNKEIFTNNFKDSHFDLLIWEKINKALYYPEIFTYFLIEGDIKAEISINHDGTLKNLPYVKNQGNKHLEHFIIKKLKTAFKTPFDKNQHGNPKRTYNYDIKFKFYISYIPDEVIENNDLKLEGKRLNFFRKSFNYKKSPIEKHLPFFMGGGSQINFVNAYNKLSGKDKIIRKQKEKELQSFNQFNNLY